MVDFLTRLPTFSNGRYPDDDIHLKNVQTNMNQLRYFPDFFDYCSYFWNCKFSEGPDDFAYKDSFFPDNKR